MTRVLDLVTGEIGLNATPLVAGDVVVVGAAHRPGGSPRTMNNAKGYVRGYDAKTGKRLWIFHTLPKPGEFGYDTWLTRSAAEKRQHRRVGADRAPTSSSASSTCASRCRPAITMAATGRATRCSTKVSSRSTSRPAQRKWHYQFVHHGIWDYDLPCAAVLFDVMVNGRRIRAVAQPTKQAFLFVLNRETGEPIGRSKSVQCRSRPCRTSGRARHSLFPPGRFRSTGKACRWTI